MSTIKISQLPSITGANTAGTDLLPLVDTSLNVTNKITREEFFKNIASIEVTSITFDGTPITATADELNVLDGITATTAELNILDGLVVSTTELNYVDGVTSPIQTQLDGKVDQTSDTGSAVIPSGTDAQRDLSPLAGYLRFNTTSNQFEGYNGSLWGEIGGGGGATGGGNDQVFIENDQVVTTDYTIPANKNAMSTGPVTINSGVTVTVSTGARYVVI